MREVQASDAKARLAELPTAVERGETIVITRHGRRIARLAPETGLEQAEIDRAIDDLARFREGATKAPLQDLLRARHQRPQISTGFVIDASILAGFARADERQPRAIRAVERLRSERAVGPSVLYFEIRSVLLVSERRRRLTANETEELLRVVARLPIRIDADCVERRLMSLAREHRLRPMTPPISNSPPERKASRSSNRFRTAG